MGNLISNELKEKGYAVTGINRKLLYGPIEDLKNEIRNTHVVINLAGVSILKRWTKQNKVLIYDSRIKTTSNLVTAINELNENERPKKMVSASAVGIYKAGQLHSEESKDFDETFVGKLVADWEASLDHLVPGVQKNIFRIGLVLGRKAKTITNLLLPFKLGIGGTIGDGKHPFPFIHEKDLVKAFVWAVEDAEESGTFNLVAPEQITNADFTKAFAKKLRRPAFIPVPAFVLKIIFGEAAVLLLESPAVEPKALKKKGFSFIFPTIETALEDILD